MQQPEWDEARYRELNNYFRERIQQLLTSDPHLQSQVAQGNSLQLAQIVECMTLNDQVDWQEFLQLDQIKMQQALQDHLEGKGTPLNAETSFYRSSSRPPEEEEDKPLW